MVSKIEKYIFSIKSFEVFLKNNINNVVFLCVGNFDVWYDSFGPIVGDLLIKKYNISSFVYGCTENNIKLSNINDFISWISMKHPKSKVVVIDAAISKSYDKNLMFKEGAIKCAYYSDKTKPYGDFSILCPIYDKIADIQLEYKKIISNALIISDIIANIYLKCNKR